MEIQGAFATVDVSINTEASQARPLITGHISKKKGNNFVLFS